MRAIGRIVTSSRARRLEEKKARKAAKAFLKSPYYRFFRFAPPGHFYSPVPDLEDVRAATEAAGSASALPGININEGAQIALAAQLAQFRPNIPFPQEKSPGNRYCYNNTYFRQCDATVLYAMLRFLAPRRIIEIGSGFSSAAMLDVNDRFFSGKIEFAFVEPHPERLLDLLHPEDLLSCTLLQKRAQEVPAEVFMDLDKNDILFIDSSHVVKANSDVNHLIFSVLPKLKAGVVVHVHDIPWPFEYPQAWFDQGRCWSEAYLVRAFLQFNTSFEILFFNSFMAARHRARLASVLPEPPANPSPPANPGNTSLWLRKTA